MKRRGGNPPKTLYHYTTPAGLLGIVKSRTIWATNFNYLNDASEFRYALATAQAVVQTRLARLKRGSAASLLKALLHELRGPSNTWDACVFSLSEDGDLLSQWRAYCPDGGFAVGFSSSLLRPPLEQQSAYLGPCLYVVQEQRSQLRSMLDVTLALLGDGPTSPDQSGDAHLGRLKHHFFEELVRLAPFLKDPSFKEEREWRAVRHTPIASMAGLAFRASASMIIPYMTFPLSDDKHPLEFDQILVGPSPNQALARQAVADLLIRHDIRVRSLTLSRIPVRRLE